MSPHQWCDESSFWSDVWKVKCLWGHNLMVFSNFYCQQCAVIMEVVSDKVTCRAVWGQPKLFKAATVLHCDEKCIVEDDENDTQRLNEDSSSWNSWESFGLTKAKSSDLCFYSATLKTNQFSLGHSKNSSAHRITSVTLRDNRIPKFGWIFGKNSKQPLNVIS